MKKELKKRTLKQRDFTKLASFRGEINLRTRSESLDEKNFKYSRKQKHINKMYFDN